MAETPNPLLDVQIQASDGSAAAPSVCFRNSQISGFYLSSADTIGISCAGSSAGTISASGLSLITPLSASNISGTFGAVKLQKYTVTAAQLTTSGTAVALLSGTALPIGAIVIRSYIRVTTSFAGNGDSGSSIKIGIQDQSVDVHASATLSTYAAGMVEGVSTGTAANMKIIATSTKQLATTWTAGGTDTALSTGSMDVYLEYVNG